ncbi:MAG: glutaredoxin family protein, partial [Proteobacteria bacterium]|nr:glutaredoxin family protein [Pseudomonadota bacterium]
MPDKAITLYALSTCIHCKKTKEYLDDCGAKYDCIFVDKLEGDERKQIIE